MKAECLYPTIIIRGEGDVAAFTVYDWLFELLKSNDSYWNI
jgi:hypothetical protein